MVNESVNEVLRNVKKYDLIEIFRGAIEHWAIYIGDGYVIHFGLASGSFSSVVSSSSSGDGTDGIVKKELLVDVAKDSVCRIGQLDEAANSKGYAKLDPGVIYKNLKLALKKSRRWYHVTKSNCEQFVTEMRYGYAFSLQAQRAGEAVTVAAAAGAGITLLFGSLHVASHR